MATLVFVYIVPNRILELIGGNLCNICLRCLVSLPFFLSSIWNLKLALAAWAVLWLYGKTYGEIIGLASMAIQDIG